jgi:integrase
VINLAIREQGLSINNVFSGTFILDDEAKTLPLPAPTNVIMKVQDECMQLDDEPRWLIALISDTGMRLGEANELLKEDIKLHDRIPHNSAKLSSRPTSNGYLSSPLMATLILWSMAG